MVLMLDRTGSFPLMNLAEDFGVPVELVWNFAWSIKKVLTGADPWPPLDIVTNLIIADLKYRLGDDEYARLYWKLFPIMVDFAYKQGTIF